MHFNNGISAGCKGIFFFSCCCCKLWFGKKSVINLIAFSLILTSQHNLPACLPSNSNIYSWPNWLWGRSNEQYFIVLVAAHALKTAVAVCSYPATLRFCLPWFARRPPAELNRMQGDQGEWVLEWSGEEFVKDAFSQSSLDNKDFPTIWGLLKTQNEAVLGKFGGKIKNSSKKVNKVLGEHPWYLMLTWGQLWASLWLSLSKSPRYLGA